MLASWKQWVKESGEVGPCSREEGSPDMDGKAPMPTPPGTLLRLHILKAAPFLWPVLAGKETKEYRYIYVYIYILYK